MHRATRLKLDDLNRHFICVLCDGYLIDATTIIECLHSFCRTCIVRYLENSRFCPVCDVQVHKTKPLQSIRSDKTLQDIVYKLVPDLYQNEMKRRKELYAEHPEAASNCTPEDKGEGAEQRFIYAPDETISLSLEYFSERNKESSNKEISDRPEEKPSESEGKDPQKRYLQCPAAITVGHLKKFISMKFGLPVSYSVDVIHHEDILNDDYTLMDIAYIYSWKRAGPMQFFYNITRRVIKRIKTINAAEKPPLPSISEEPLLTDTPCDPNEENSEPKQKLQKLDSEEKSSDSTSCQPVESCHKDNTKSDSAEAAPVVVESSKPDAPKPISQNEAVPAVGSSRNETPASTEIVPVPCNAAKIVETSTTTVIPTTNGTLKFIQRPILPDQVKSRNKKPVGKRSAGRTSRYKSNTRAPLVRLAPYPPPSSAPPVTCLATAPMTHLAPISVRNLMPAVTGLPPLMTLRAPTVNTLCNSTMNSIVPNNAPLVATSFRGYRPNTTTNYISQTVNTATPVLPTHFSNVPPGFVTTTETVTSLRPATIDVPPNVLSAQPLPTTQSNITVPTENPPSQVHIETPIKPITVQTNSNTLASCGAPIVTMVSSSQPSATPKINDIPVVVSTTPSITISPAASIAVTTKSAVLPVTEHSDNSIVPPPILPCTVRLCPNVVPNNINVDHKELSIPIVSSAASVQVTFSVPKLDTAKNSINSLPKTVNGTPTPKTSESKCNSIVKSPAVKSPPAKSPVKDGLAFPRTFTIEKKSEDYPFKITVKNTISAEFSDNDDLGCQPDLVVDEQKLDSSDNEDDDALRKKITAIAEKEDEADATDDTEADSGRASDISSQARSSCDDDVGSPMMSVSEADRTVVSSTATSTTTTTPAFSSHLPPFTTPVHAPSSLAVSTSTTEEGHRPTKSMGIDHVISNLYRNHEKKDTFGALDLSTCTRKPGEEAPRSRQKAVANPPVLDIKHRQQTCLSAPKQHTACVPSPKHPTSSTLHLAGMAAAHHSMLSANPALHNKLPMPYNPLAFPCPNRASSSPTARPAFNSMLAPNAHQNFPPLMPPTPHQCMGGSTTFQGWTPVPPATTLQGRSTPTASPRRNDSSPIPNKLIPTSKQSCTSPSGGAQHRKASLNSDSNRQHSKSANSRNGSDMSSPSPHRKASPNTARSSPNSFPTTTSRLVNNVPCSSSTSTVSSAAPTMSPASYKLSPSIPIYNKKSNSYKNHSYRFKGSNLAVINPDPTGCRQKIVIKNLDFRPNNHQPQRL